jgi:hypothetical protein
MNTAIGYAQVPTSGHNGQMTAYVGDTCCEIGM